MPRWFLYLHGQGVLVQGQCLLPGVQKGRPGWGQGALGWLGQWQGSGLSPCPHPCWKTGLWDVSKLSPFSLEPIRSSTTPRSTESLLLSCRDKLRKPLSCPIKPLLATHTELVAISPTLGTTSPTARTSKSSPMTCEPEKMEPAPPAGADRARTLLPFVLELFFPIASFSLPMQRVPGEAEAAWG